MRDSSNHHEQHTLKEKVGHDSCLARCRRQWFYGQLCKAQAQKSLNNVTMAMVIMVIHEKNSHEQNPVIYLCVHVFIYL
jgi:hypothetical protein